jgi:hypothetical protein
MSFRKDQEGFIFSLDATLAMLVLLIVMAGVARVAGPELIYGQHGYLRLERYANDALEMMQLTGTMDNIVTFVKHGDLDSAENLARTELRKIVPGEVQFRLVIGDNRLTVYPSDVAGWASAFSNAEEIAVATRMSTFHPKEPPINVLAWLDDELDENFMRELVKCTNWENTNVNTEVEFRAELSDVGWTQKYDVIFIPDSQTDFSDDLNWRLVEYNWYGATLVVGGDTLWNNDSGTWDPQLWEILGVEGWGSVSGGTNSPRILGEPEFNYMRISNDNDVITAPYNVRNNIEYSGEDYAQYVYRQIDDEYVDNLAIWDNVPAGWSINPTPWPGIIVRENGYVVYWWGPGNWWWGRSFPYSRAVLFNMRFAQSAMDLDPTIQPKGTQDWITLVRRAIGYEQVFEPITLYVWRGAAVG